MQRKWPAWQRPVGRDQPSALPAWIQGQSSGGAGSSAGPSPGSFDLLDDLPDLSNLSPGQPGRKSQRLHFFGVKIPACRWDEPDKPSNHVHSCSLVQVHLLVQVGFTVSLHAWPAGLSLQADVQSMHTGKLLCRHKDSMAIPVGYIQPRIWS